MKNFRTGALVSALLFLSGCDELDVELPQMSFLRPAVSDSAAMFLGMAQVKSPAGFCIDRSSSQLATGFALVVPCPVLDEASEFPEHPAFITVQMGGRATSGVAGSEDYINDRLMSDDFATILNDPSATEILETDIEGGAVAVHYRTAADERTEGLSKDVWRIFADVDGRLTTISLRGYESAPLTVDDGRALIYSVLENLRDVNA